MRSTPRSLRRLLRWYPPFWAAGIRVLAIADDWRHAKVELRAHWYSRNYVGTHFGGSLFAMTDPFWMILVMESLGRDYIVWDKRGEIEFVAARSEPVYAEFALDDAVLDELRAAVASEGKTLRWFETEVRTAAGEVVAKVRKQIYVRRRNAES